MDEAKIFEEFSLLGGPFHRLGCRLGLVRGDTNTVALGLVLGLFLWSIFVALAIIDHGGHRLFSLTLIGGHVRLLVAIPLFFLCESWFDPRAKAFVGLIVRSGVAPEKELPALASEITRIRGWKDSWVPDAMCLVGAVLLSSMGSRVPLSGATAVYDPTRAIAELALAGQWYWIVCLTLFRFLVFRWLWRIGVWWYFLSRVAKLNLHLVPTHPDGAAGLGYLDVVQNHFIPLVLAISAVQSAAFAEEIVAGSSAFEAIYPLFALVLTVDAVLFLGPLHVFASKLWACRVKGLSDYMEFAARYVNGFDEKWLGRGDPPGEPLLGTPDVQSLADLSNSVTIVRNMRSVPLSRSLVVSIVAAAVVPMLPLLLIKYPIAELAEKFFRRLSGL
jgi:hypothetical protein